MNLKMPPAEKHQIFFNWFYIIVSFVLGFGISSLIWAITILRGLNG